MLDSAVQSRMIKVLLGKLNWWVEMNPGKEPFMHIKIGERHPSMRDDSGFLKGMKFRDVLLEKKRIKKFEKRVTMKNETNQGLKKHIVKKKTISKVVDVEEVVVDEFDQYLVKSKLDVPMQIDYIDEIKFDHSEVKISDTHVIINHKFKTTIMNICGNNKLLTKNLLDTEKFSEEEMETILSESLSSFPILDNRKSLCEVGCQTENVICVSIDEFRDIYEIITSNLGKLSVTTDMDKSAGSHRLEEEHEQKLNAYDDELDHDDDSSNDGSDCLIEEDFG